MKIEKAKETIRGLALVRKKKIEKALKKYEEKFYARLQWILVCDGSPVFYDKTLKVAPIEHATRYSMSEAIFYSHEIRNEFGHKAVPTKYKEYLEEELERIKGLLEGLNRI